MLRTSLLLLLTALPVGAAEKAEVTISPCKAFSTKGGKVELVWVGQPKEMPTTTISDFTKPVEIPPGGQYDLFYIPKGGMKVSIRTQWSPKAGANAIQLSDSLGTAVVFGDNLPRVDAIVLTAESDPGPGEKGYAPIERVGDYKDDLIVPAGFYSVWIVPATGAKAQRIADRIRVQAGRETRIGD